MSNNLNDKKVKEEAYAQAKKAQYEAEARPSKVSAWPLVNFVEEDGVQKPVYREQG